MKYFSHPLSSREDDRVWQVIDKHGLTGYGAWWVVVEELYKAIDDEFQIACTSIWIRRLSKELGIDEMTLPRILDTFAEVGLISPQLWAEKAIFSPDVKTGADAYLKKKEANAERKRKERRNKSQESHTPVTRDPSIYISGSNEEDCLKDQNIEIEGSRESHAPVTRDRNESFGQIPEWRNNNSPNGLKPEFVAYVRDVYFPTLPEFKDGKSKPDTLRARNWITIRERSREADYQVLLNVVAQWQAANPEPDRREERDRQWLEEAMTLKNRFYKTPEGGIDPDRWDFYQAHKHLIFPEESVNA